jgi:hypothetical protein
MTLVLIVFQLAVLAGIVYMFFVDARYTLRRRASKNWPATAATIDSGIVGSSGPLASLPSILYRVHFTYSYQVNGLQHSGRFFCLTQGKQRGEELRRALVGKSVSVRYDVRKPEVALLVDDELAGKRVMQGPSWTYR